MLLRLASAACCNHDVTSIDIGFDISDTSRLSELDEEIIRLHCECGELQVGL